MQEDAVPVTFQTVGVVNPLDTAQSSAGSVLTTTFSQGSEMQASSWLDLGGSLVPDQSADLFGSTRQADKTVQKPADNVELATPVLSAELFDPTQMISTAAATPGMTLDTTDFQQEEDITEQLLGDQDEELPTPRATPKKKRPASPESEEPIAPKATKVTKNTARELKESKVDSEETGENVFSVDRVAVNSLVTVMIDLKDVMSKVLKAVERVEKRLTDSSSDMGKVSDGMHRLQKAVEEKETQDRYREERRINWERKQEEEKRKEKEEERRREDRRREAERKERGERRRQEERKREGKENSPEPKVKSVLGRCYTENSIKDIHNRK
ncbi:MAG: hypothetical protein AB2693_19325 [Candidatus Thiodiazotropha sp.]